MIPNHQWKIFIFKNSNQSFSKMFQFHSWNEWNLFLFNHFSNKKKQSNKQFIQKWSIKKFINFLDSLSKWKNSTNLKFFSIHPKQKFKIIINSHFIIQQNYPLLVYSFIFFFLSNTEHFNHHILFKVIKKSFFFFAFSIHQIKKEFIN